MTKRLLGIRFNEYTQLDGRQGVFVQRIGDGSIIKRFDRTPNPEKGTDVVCPHFLELKWAYGCPFDCAWCFLKGTLRLLDSKTKPVVKDYDKVRRHLESFLENDGQSGEALNTGELADSLMNENTRKPFSGFIIPLFEEQVRHKVLFVTKSTNIKNLVGIESHTQVIVSFSLNAPYVARKWEKAPTVEKRIEAAKALSELDYEVRVRIDPLVPIEDWEKEYIGLLDSVFEKFTPERITLGSLRGLQSTINNAKDRSWVAFVTEKSNWGKKVPFDMRCQIYSTVTEYLRSEYGYNKIALCKETVDMWGQLGMDYTKIQCNCLL